MVTVDVNHQHACACMQDDIGRLPPALTFLDVSETLDPEVGEVQDVNVSRLSDTLSFLWRCPQLTTFIARDVGAGQLHTYIFCCDLKDVHAFHARHLLGSTCYFMGIPDKDGHPSNFCMSFVKQL